MIGDVLVGHWTDATAKTGCTVLLFPEGSVASGEVRGGAPGTREWELLDPTKMVQRIDAVVLAGGSAYGLAACDGVMAWCEERGRGFATAGGVVPIVVGAVLYDLAQGDGKVRPTAASGYEACAVAEPWQTGAGPAVGLVGAGTGAMVNKWRGMEHARPGGIGYAAITDGTVTVATLIAVYAWGDVVDPALPLPVEGAAAVFANKGFNDGPTERDGTPTVAPSGNGRTNPEVGTNTTIGVVMTDATLDKVGCQLLAQSAHDGLARAIWPVHTTADGDAIVAVSVGRPADDPPNPAPIDLVRMLCVEATARAIRAACSVVQ